MSIRIFFLHNEEKLVVNILLIFSNFPCMAVKENYVLHWSSKIDLHIFFTRFTHGTSLVKISVQKIVIFCVTGPQKILTYVPTYFYVLKCVMLCGTTTIYSSCLLFIVYWKKIGLYIPTWFVILRRERGDLLQPIK